METSLFVDSISVLLVHVLSGIGCYQIAKLENRSTTTAAFLGMLFGDIALLIYALIGVKPSNI